MSLMHHPLLLETFLACLSLGLGIGLVVSGRYFAERERHAQESVRQLDYLKETIGMRNRELVESAQRLQNEITERMKKERLAIQAEKLASVGQLTAGVAHELNNPLAVILGFAETLTRSAVPQEQYAEVAVSIEREARRCSMLVKNLLNFSRSHEPGKEPADLAEVIGQALLFVQPLAHLKNMEVTSQLAPGLPPLLMDVNKIQQVIINLCTNAVDAMPKGKTLVVGCGPDISGVKLWVKDEGCGIPADIQKRIFEPFFTTKAPGQGTGLGLSLVADIIKEHGGRIEITSIVGEGTTFTIFLPQDAAGLPGPLPHYN
jgi:two-component system NtrC family sensor kinase